MPRQSVETEEHLVPVHERKVLKETEALQVLMERKAVTAHQERMGSQEEWVQ